VKSSQTISAKSHGVARLRLETNKRAVRSPVLATLWHLPASEAVGNAMRN
jgi:hypothetical protein